MNDLFFVRTLFLIGAFALVSTMSQGHQQAHAQTLRDNTNDTSRVVEDFRDPLDEDWTWVRENPDGWRKTDAGLKILVEPGTMWSKTSDAKNVLLRRLPEGWESGVDITCELWHSPKKRWEQANLVWYFDDGHMIKIGLEIEHGVANIVMGRKEKNQRKTPCESNRNASPERSIPSPQFSRQDVHGRRLCVRAADHHPSLRARRRRSTRGQ